MTGPWVGIDPGSVSTGIVVRYGNRLLWHRVVHRDEDEDVVRGVGVGPAYLTDVMAAMTEAMQCVHATGHMANVAVEGVVPPNPHIKTAKGERRITNPGPVMGTAMVLGAILARFPAAVVVPPGDHGHGMLGSYPEPLVTAAEARRGLRRQAGDSSDIRHCRAAWDCAGQGPIHAALRSARRPTTGAAS